MTTTETTNEEWLELIRSEYLEIPGLNLTKSQVQRLWGLDPDRSQNLLDILVKAHFLRRTHASLYMRADAGV